MWLFATKKQGIISSNDVFDKDISEEVTLQRNVHYTKYMYACICFVRRQILQNI